VNLAEQIAQLRQLLPMSRDSRLLDVLMLNIVEELYEVVAAVRDGDPPLITRPHDWPHDS
jgi:NTP pyrophosphatase (non-canonical NTP hydrolase)